MVVATIGLVQELRQSGFLLRREGVALKVNPSSRLSADQREAVKKNKEEILTYLAEEEMWPAYSRVCLAVTRLWRLQDPVSIGKALEALLAIAPEPNPDDPECGLPDHERRELREALLAGYVAPPSPVTDREGRFV